MRVSLMKKIRFIYYLAFFCLLLSFSSSLVFAYDFKPTYYTPLYKRVSYYKDTLENAKKEAKKISLGENYIWDKKESNKSEGFSKSFVPENTQTFKKDESPLDLNVSNEEREAIPSAPPVEEILPDASNASSLPLENLSNEEGVISIETLEVQGIIFWEGFKFSYYSERILPGPGLNIPGRHTSQGFVRDENEYLVLASNIYPMGTILATPFGASGVVRDYCPECSPNQLDVYTR